MLNKYSLAIIAAGTMWAFMGLFTRELSTIGFSSGNAVFIRALGGAVMFGVTILLQDRSMFKFKPKHLWCFLGTGICSQMFFSTAYAMTVEITSLAVAAILLYTAPAFVTIMSVILFGEKFTKRKALALVLSFGGCCLVSGFSSGETALTFNGFILGLCSGFGYALYSIFARYAMLRGYCSMTINFYTAFFAAIGTGIVFGFMYPIGLAVSSWQVFVLCVAFALVMSYLPYMCYTYGLTKTENSKASVMASIEPVMAAVVGIVVYKEQLTLLSVTGICLVLSAIVILNLGEVKQ